MCFCKVVCGQLEPGQLDRYMLSFSRSLLWTSVRDRVEHNASREERKIIQWMTEKTPNLLRPTAEGENQVN